MKLLNQALQPRLKVKVPGIGDFVKLLLTQDSTTAGQAISNSDQKAVLIALKFINPDVSPEAKSRIERHFNLISNQPLQDCIVDRKRAIKIYREIEKQLSQLNISNTRIYANYLSAFLYAGGCTTGNINAAIEKLPEFSASLANNQLAKNVIGALFGVATFFANWSFISGDLAGSQNSMNDSRLLSALTILPAFGSSTIDASFPYNASEIIGPHLGINNQDYNSALSSFCDIQAYATLPIITMVCCGAWIDLITKLKKTRGEIRETGSFSEMIPSITSAVITAGCLAFGITRLIAFLESSKDTYDSHHLPPLATEMVSILALIGEGPLTIVSMYNLGKFAEPYIKSLISRNQRPARTYVPQVDEDTNPNQLAISDRNKMSLDEKGWLIWDIVKLSLNAIGNGLLILNTRLSKTDIWNLISAIFVSAAVCGKDTLKKIKAQLEVVNAVVGNGKDGCNTDHGQTVNDYFSSLQPSPSPQAPAANHVELQPVV